MAQGNFYHHSCVLKSFDWFAWSIYDEMQTIMVTKTNDAIFGASVYLTLTLSINFALAKAMLKWVATGTAIDKFRHEQTYLSAFWLLLPLTITVTGFLFNMLSGGSWKYSANA